MAKRFNYRFMHIEIPSHPNAQKLLNQLHTSNITLRHVKVTEKSIQFEITRAALPVLRKLRRKYRVPIKMHYADEEQIIRFDRITFIGILFLIVIPFIASQWVWKVQVDSNIPELRVRIEETLYNQLHMKPPFQKKILQDDMKIRQLLLEKHRDLAWVHIKKEGSTIQFTPQLAPEQVQLPQKNDKPMHLIAAKNGVITHFDIESGVRSVLPNTSVYAGDLLVSGVLQSGESYQVIGAQGEVYADYWLECSFSVPRSVELVAQQSRKWVVLFRWFHQSEFNKTYYEELQLPKVFAPFIKIVSTQSKVTVKQEITQDTVQQMVMPLLHQKVLQSLPPKTVIKKQNLLHVQIDDDTVKGKVLFLINENIAKTQPVDQGE